MSDNNMCYTMCDKFNNINFDEDYMLVAKTINSSILFTASKLYTDVCLFINSLEFCELCVISVLLVLLVLCVIYKCLKGTNTQNVTLRTDSTEKSWSRVIKMKYGYPIMSCSDEFCDEVATYGLSRGAVGTHCVEHMGNRGLVKVFGCEKLGCKKKVIRGTITCREHSTAEGA